MTMFDKSRGRERQGIDERAINTALENWEKASEENKPKCAIAVLSNIGAVGGKLNEYISDPKKAQDIRDDAKRA